jgi:N-acetylneuraminate synthase
MKFKLGSKTINSKKQPYFIAEIGVNFENNLQRAKKIIKLAKEGGADAVKFQSYKAEKIACKNSPYYWDLKKVPVKSQYELFKKFDKFGFKEFKKLKEYCDKLKIDFLSTPFDLDAVDYLNNLVPFFKIASADLNNYPLIDKICKKNKPIVLSTGASKISEIKKTINFIKKKNSKIPTIILHCVLSYPTKNEDAHLELIQVLKKKFSNNIIGYSDHTMPDENMMVLTSAYLNGATVIEKHFSDVKGLTGNDHFHSLNKEDLIKFRSNINILNSINKNLKEREVLNCEKISRKNARRSIVSNATIKKGEKITIDKIIMKRPGTGLSPDKLNLILNKKASKNIEDDTIIKISDILC